MMDPSVPGWSKLSQIDPESFKEARIQAHWAARIVGAVGEALVPARSDDSHTSLNWVDGPELLAGVAFQAGLQPIHAAVDIGSMEQLLLTADRQILQKQSLENLSIAEACRWYSEVIREAGYHEGIGELPLFTRDIPDHPLGSGGRFAFQPGHEYAELRKWFGDSHRILTAFSEQLDAPGISPIRCWPHHFDIALLWTLDQDADPEQARSVGMGMTPGDTGYNTPYFYVTMWPYPEDPVLPDLTTGHWHT